jgi:glycosyltransferase involved in cell wall biosynthesis
MRILLVPDQTSPNGEDAFCREIAKRAFSRGHNAVISADASLEADVVLVNNMQPELVRAAQSAGRRTVIRLIEDLQSPDLRALALKADLLLVPSDHLAAKVKAWGANGSVRKVPYAYDRIMAQQIALVTVRASRPTGFHLVTSGRLDESRRAGIETLLSALTRLRMDVHLTVIGDGPLRAALEERARAYGVADRVAFLGDIPHPKAMEYFRAAKAYVDPSGVDGYPALALHALSEGCPVVAARSGALTELIKDGVNGLLFRPGDVGGLCEAVVTLYSERGLSLRLMQEGIRTVESQNWDATVDAALTALESL